LKIKKRFQHNLEAAQVDAPSAEDMVLGTLVSVIDESSKFRDRAERDDLK